MNKLLTGLFAGLISISISISAMAAHHGSAEDEVRAAVVAFAKSYETNDIEGYFGQYTDDAEVFFYGERQDMDAYKEETVALVKAGGGVEQDKMSGLIIQMLPGGEAAITSTFIDNRSRSAEGEISTERGFETCVWQKIDGEWKVANLHYTVVTPEE